MARFPLALTPTGVPGVATIEALEQGEVIEGHVPATLYPDFGLLVANVQGQPVPLNIPPQSLVGRLSSGSVGALSVENLKTLLSMVETSSGAPDAGKPVKLDGAGKLDASVLPAVVQQGEANDAENLGSTGARPYSGKNGVTLQFRRLQALTPDMLTLTETSEGIEVRVTTKDADAAAAGKLWSSLKVSQEVGARLSNLVEDTSPALGGNLDIGALALVSGATELFRWDETEGKLYINGLEAIIPVLTNEQPGDIVQRNAQGQWVNVPLGSLGGIPNLQADPTPTLGGMLNENGQGIGDGTRKALGFTHDPAAANNLRIDSAATGVGPTLAAEGADPDVDLNLVSKGTGTVNVNGRAIVETLFTALADGDVLIYSSGRIINLGAGAVGEVFTIDGTGMPSWAAPTTTLADDSSPELAGDLKVGTHKLLDANDNPALDFNALAAAVNYFRIQTTPTGVGPVLQPVGGDTNIDLILRGKNAGRVLWGLKALLTDYRDPVRIESPGGAEQQLMLYTPVALTVERLVAAVVGGTDLTWTLKYASTPYGTATEVVTGGTATAAGTPSDVTTFDAAAIPAGSYVWVETTAVNGSPTEFLLTPILYRT